ncbi:zinc-binding dehydrogenase [Hydrogenophaga sp.]
MVDKVFPFEDTDKASAYVESGRAKGKVGVQMM